MTLKSYAIKHKLSMFNVMKMVRSGQVESVVEHEDGRDVTYILIDEEREKEIAQRIVKADSKEEMDLKEEIQILKREVAKLKEEIAVLKQKL